MNEPPLVYLRPKSAAQYLDISIATFWRLVAKGGIKKEMYCYFSSISRKIIALFFLLIFIPRCILIFSFK